MNDHALNDANLGVGLTEAEMADVIGGGSPVLYGLGYVAGFMAALISATATSPDMQAYLFGA